ncbi:hypothetical protein KIH39_10415 [Telmatocola sphagniphila]|uniref:Uncharacterized protein n=1 Tax=Telmatocola sphagniphila TaxID=1123043 RepID=A0A8E6F0W7_9BACT|nr:hypothetical protein [Telmatocola sphagniphila]QVL35021.1 hypothetical protein KIH39_10415 [Telmatocola sphagniphila]
MSKMQGLQKALNDASGKTKSPEKPKPTQDMQEKPAASKKSAKRENKEFVGSWLNCPSPNSGRICSRIKAVGILVF